MWYSFPCIRIPDETARMSAQWFYNEARYDGRYDPWAHGKKDDDVMFRWFLKQHEPVLALNLYPNIVNHIDYLLGGSVINSARAKDINTMAKYWKDTKTLEKIEKELSNAGEKN